MPTSLCFNCSSPKSPPYTAHYCDDCERSLAAAREKALKAGENPSEAGRNALAIRAFSPMSTRPNPRTPFTNLEATLGALAAREIPREGA